MGNKQRTTIKNTITKPFSRLFSRKQKQTQAALFTTLRSHFSFIIDTIEKLSTQYETLLGWEITYRQEGNNLIATNFFPQAKTIVTQKDIDDFLTEIHTNQQLLASIIDELNQTTMPPYTKKMFLNRCTEMQQNLELFESTVYSEAEKWWWQSDPQNKGAPYHPRTKKIWDVFWPSVSSNPQESRQCLDKMAWYYNKNNTRLTPEEQAYFENFLTSIGKHYNRTTNNIAYSENDDTDETDKAEWKESHSSLFLQGITRSTQKQLCELLQQTEFDDPSNKHAKHHIQPRAITLDPNKKNVVAIASQETIYLPDDGATISLIDLLKNYQHEIGKHASAGYNANAFFGKWWKGAGYLGIEEGLAKLFEAIVTGKVKTLRDIPSITEKPSIGMVATFVCEHYAFEEAVKIMTIYEKLTRKKETKKTKSPEDTAKDMVIRRKRFVPYDRPWASTKDCIYTRWLREVAALFAKCTTIKQAYTLLHTLNFAKLWPSDIPHTDTIKQELGITDDMTFRTTFLPRRIVTDINDKEWIEHYPSRLWAIRDRVLKKLWLRKKTFDDMHAAHADQRTWRWPYRYHPLTTKIIDIIRSA